MPLLFISFKLKHKEAWCTSVYGGHKKSEGLNDWALFCYSVILPLPPMHLDHNRKQK